MCSVAVRPHGEHDLLEEGILEAASLQARNCGVFCAVHICPTFERACRKRNHEMAHRSGHNELSSHVGERHGHEHARAKMLPLRLAAFEARLDLAVAVLNETEHEIAAGSVDELAARIVYLSDADGQGAGYGVEGADLSGW